ncbi:MAG: S8 family serine peptidase [candidate division Zixibacteria bacterium]|nr:S8 family serine peptidase [candidate division Zixibacteria bacterium]
MERKNLLVIAILFVISFTFFLPIPVYSLYSGETISRRILPEYAPGRLIVKFKPEAHNRMVSGKVTTGIASLDSLNSKYKVKKQEKLFKKFEKTALKEDKFLSVYILEVPTETDLENMKKDYEKRPEIEYVELDYKVELLEAPDDPLFDNQWYLNNTGQGYMGTKRVSGDYNDLLVIKYGNAGADIDALEAFGKNLETVLPLVGIIDTGVDREHEDLKDNIWTNPGEIPDNVIDDDHNGFTDDSYGWDFSGEKDTIVFQEDNDPSDYYGHGTHCAGIVAGVKDNGIGISGITSHCRIMAIKIFPNAFFSVGTKAIIYAADMGCNIINMSWGGPYPSKLLEDAIDYAVSKGVLSVAAAGNSGAEDYFYPASLPQVFTVGASNSKDEVTYFSTYNEYIDVIAPGEDILSLRAINTDMYAEGGASGLEPTVHIVDDKYYLADGTSMAAPCAAGVAAFILAASPGISITRVKEILQQSADDIIYPYGGDSLYSPGKDIYSGYGRVNLNSALQLLSGRLAKIDYPFENMLVSGYVPIIGTASGDSFQNYILDYGEGYTPESWSQIANSVIPLSKDTLGIWNSSGLSGVYTLRLTVGDQNREVVHLIAGNSPYVEISYPEEGDTIKGYTQISGYTIIPDFSCYTLEYGYGELPVSWDTIITSTKMIADEVLGNWMVNFLDEARYTMRLTAKANSGVTYSDSVVVEVKSIVSSGWFSELPNFGSLSPAVGDIDGDGYSEVVVGVGGSTIAEMGGIEVFSHTGELEPGWPKDTDKKMMSSPALADLNGDGIEDIVLCSNQGLHAYLSNSTSWFISVSTGGNNFWSLATPVIADLENDGHNEILMINNSGKVYAWRDNGSSFIPGNNGVFAQAIGNEYKYEDFPCLIIADLDNDYKNEVIAGIANGYTGGIYIWDITGTQLLAPGDYPEVFTRVFGIAVANIDDVNDLEVIVFGSNQDYLTLSAFKKNGTQVPGYPIEIEDLQSGEWFGNHPAIGDLEGDGIMEIVTSIFTIGEARIYAWHQDGTPLGVIGPDGLMVSMSLPDKELKRSVLSSLGNSIGEIFAKIREMGKEELYTMFSTSGNDPVFVSVPETFGSPILADVNADDRVDIIARAGYYYGTGYERVFAWDYEGNIIPGWPLYVSEEPASFTFYPYSPVICDVDNDGKLNLVLATDYSDLKLICWEFNTSYDLNKMHWPRYMHDKQNSGVFRLEDYLEVEEEDITVPACFSLSQNYPNPFNSITTIPFSLKVQGSTFKESTHTSLVIYNILGQKVRTLLDKEMMPGIHQAVWDGKDGRDNTVTSGIYFYRLETENYTQTKKMVFLK